MKPFTSINLLIGVLALASANPNSNRWHSNRNSLKNSFKPTEWLSVSELESLPSANEITLEKLEEMSLQEGAELLQKMYHLSQAGQALKPHYVPKASEIPCFLITPDNMKQNFRLNELPQIAREKNYFGNQEVTFFITGLPQQTETIRKATRKLVQAYMQRYNGQAPRYSNIKYEDNSNEKGNPSSSDEDEDSSKNSSKPSGNLVVIELGNLMQNSEQYMALDVEKTGMEIGNVLVQFTDKSNVPQEVVHVIGANIAAHVAGAAGRQYTRQTGHQLRRITGLDPNNIIAQRQYSLMGLARGDAEFVDAIHTSAYGFGSPIRSGDVDFYPNGPSEGVPGAKHVIEASMRAIRYFAESVVPGNERNFPAVGATSLEQYKEQNGNGKRVYMGINTDFDVEGDFILQVNSKSPFGRRTPAQRQQHFHAAHKPWKMSSRDY